jgi:acyl dehydratase
MSRFEKMFGTEIATGTFTWDTDRTQLYAIGVGAGMEDPFEELQFTTENTRGVPPAVIPTFMTTMSAERTGDWIKNLGFKARDWDSGFPEGLVHGEQRVTLARPIPPTGTADMRQVLVGVYDKGKSALIVSECHATLSDTGEYLGATRMGLFVRGQGGFGGERTPADEFAWTQPATKPDLTVSLQMLKGQALIYRLSGDHNPHGTDPNVTMLDGFDKPIFYGLGTYGFACRALLKGLCGGDVARFGAIDGRFVMPVHPGDRLDTAIWHTDGGAFFQTYANGERLVIDRGIFRYAGK